MHAFLNGRYLPAAEAGIALWDAGFVSGATVTEQLRTFGGRLFRWEQHLARLRRGLQIVGINPGPAYTDDALAQIAARLVQDSLAQLAASGVSDSDVGLAILVTPGPYAAFAGDAPPGPTVCLHTYPLAFRRWAEKYRTGEALVSVDIEMPSPRVWPPELKCRSRMHYVLAERAAEQKQPGAKALLRSAEGFLRETAVANLVILRPGPQGMEAVSPPRSAILPGVTLQAVAELCPALGLTFVEQELTSADLAGAAEAWLTSTPWGVLPVTQWEGRPIGQGVSRGAPGPQFGRVLAAWQEQTGIDLAGQARRHAT